MKNVSVQVLGLFLISSLLANTALAQSNPDLEAVLADLQPGKTLRIDSRGQGRVQGKYQGRSEEALQLETKEGPREVHLEGIERIWLRGRATRTMALLGAVAGAISLGWLGAEFSGSCEVDCENAARDAALAGGSLGALSGAGLGALVGTAIPDWKLRYARTRD